MQGNGERESFFSDKMSLYSGGIARQSFPSSGVCVLVRRASTRVQRRTQIIARVAFPH